MSLNTIADFKTIDPRALDAFRGFALGGAEVVTDTSAHAVSFTGILAVKSSTVSAITVDATLVTGNSLVGEVLEPGFHPVHGSSITFSGAPFVYLIKS